LYISGVLDRCIVYFRCSMTSILYISGELWQEYCIFQVFYDRCILYLRCVWQVYGIFQVFYDQCIVYFMSSITNVLYISGVL
jgi:hypothetical protein